MDTHDDECDLPLGSALSVPDGLKRFLGFWFSLSMFYLFPMFLIDPIFVFIVLPGNQTQIAAEYKTPPWRKSHSQAKADKSIKAQMRQGAHDDKTTAKLALCAHSPGGGRFPTKVAAGPRMLAVQNSG